MQEPIDADALMRHRRQTWDDADLTDALDELVAQLDPPPEPRTSRTPEERAARDDWRRTDSVA